MARDRIAKDISPWPNYRGRDGVWLPPKREGLARVLAKAGYGARPRAEALVQAGRLTVDGRVVRDPAQPVTARSEIRLDGQILCEAVRHYLAMNKPAGVDCQPGGSVHLRHVGRYLGGEMVGLESAGRLAVSLRGLILLSNDLWWNTRVCQNAGLARSYEVFLKGRVSGGELAVINAGMVLPSRGHFRAESIVVVDQREQGTLIDLTVKGGHDRQIRNAFTTLHREVLWMARTALGPVTLQGLAGGQFRALTAAEIDALAGLAG